MSQTDRSRFSAAVKQYADGTPFIAFETCNRNSPPFDKMIGLDLENGVTAQDAEALVDRLNALIATVALTTTD
jgi:hypothetical protein